LRLFTFVVQSATLKVDGFGQPRVELANSVAALLPACLPDLTLRASAKASSTSASITSQTFRAICICLDCADAVPFVSTLANSLPSSMAFSSISVKQKEFWKVWSDADS
jgi:hypothetical protein